MAFHGKCIAEIPKIICRVFLPKHKVLEVMTLTLSSVLERGIYVDQVQRYLCAGFSAPKLLFLPFTKFTSQCLLQLITFIIKYE